MSTAAISAPANSWMRPKYMLAAFLGVLFAYVLVHNESFLINSRDPEWQHIYRFRWYLLPHGLAGACALLLAPLQFSDRLRRRYARFHRIVGRIYVGGVLIAAPMGFYVQYFQERFGEARSFSIAASVQATTWILTTLIALAFILKGKVDQHRRWMTRSFSVALVFLEVRVVLGVTGLDALHSPAVTETVVWVCNVFALFAADVVLQAQDLFQSHAANARVARAASPAKA